jgi:hypothetical protein
MNSISRDNLLTGAVSVFYCFTIFYSLAITQSILGTESKAQNLFNNRDGFLFKAETV